MCVKSVFVHSSLLYSSSRRLAASPSSVASVNTSTAFSLPLSFDAIIFVHIDFLATAFFSLSLSSLTSKIQITLAHHLLLLFDTIFSNILHLFWLLLLSPWLSLNFLRLCSAVFSLSFSLLFFFSFKLNNSM